MSAFGKGNEGSTVDHTSLVVKDVSDNQNFAYLLSTHGETTGGFNTGSQSLSDTAMELIRMSPTHNFLVLSPKSRSGSPGLNLEDLNSSGHQIVFLNHQSKTSLAENTLQTKINIQTLTICFQYMKSLKHWRRRLKSVVFFALRRWAISSQYLRTSHHKAHQHEVLEQRKSLALLVSHHTASTKAKAVEKNERSTSSKARDSTSKPNFRPTNINPTLQPQKNRTAIPATANYVKKSTRGSPSRLKSQESDDNKDFQSDHATLVSTSNKSRSTTPTLLTAKVSALASHPFYQHTQPRSKSATLRQRSAPAEPGFDHKPLAVTNLTARADAAIQALASRVFVNSPERLIHTHSANTSATYSPGLAASTVESLSSPEQPRTLLRSPLQAFQESQKASPTPSLTLSQRIIPTRSHLTGTTSSTNMRFASSPSRFLNRSLAQQTLVSPKQSSLVHSPTRDSTVTNYGSPSAAEIAYARSRGSTASVAGFYGEPEQVHELEQEQISPSAGNALSRSQNITTVFDMENANLSTQSEKKSVVLPAAPRRRGSGGKLQSALHQHRAHQHSNLHSRSSTPVDQDSPINEQNSSVAVATVATAEGVLLLDHSGSGELEDCGRFAVSEIKTSEYEKRNNTGQVKTDLPSSKQSPATAQAEYDVMVFSSDEHAENADNVNSGALSRIRHYSILVKPSKHYTYLAFKKLQRKIVLLQELKTFELHAALPAMDSHYKRCLSRNFAALRATCLGARRAHSVANLATKNFLYLAFRRLQRKILQQQEVKASEKHAYLPASHFYKHRRVRRSFDFLRTRHLEAKISQYRSYQSAINIDNYAQVKAFWRLRKNVTHRHQSWFIEQRGVKYYRFLRMSQGFSALAQIAAYGNVPFSGDEGSLLDDASIDDADHSHAAASLVQSLRAHEENYELHSSDSDSDGEPELNVRSHLLSEDCEVRSFSDSETEKEQNNLSDVHDLSLWEDRHFDELSLSQADNSSSDDNSVTEASIAHEISPPAMLSYGRFYDDDEHSESSTEHESFAIGTIAALGLRSADNSPTPRSPLPMTPTAATATATETTVTTSTTDPDVDERSTLAAPVPATVVVFDSLVHSARSSPPHDMLPQPPLPDLHQAESLRNISRSRSDEFPGVSGLDMWDWQDLHSVSREFISDSECDSSLGRSLSMSTEEVLPRRSVTPISSRTPSPLMGIAPAPVHARPEVVASWARRLSSAVDSMSPIFANYSTSPPLPAHNYEYSQYEGEENESEEVHRMDSFSAFGAESTGSQSDLSLFLSDDSQSQDGLQVGIHIRSESRANENDVEEVEAWSPPRQYQQEQYPAPKPHSVAAAETSSQGFQLPPLPNSPCPSEGMEYAEEGNADDVTELGYISPADSDSEIVNIQQFDIFGQFSPRRKINTQKCYEAGAAYWRRTRLSQGVYALNQWVVKSQTVLTMNDILFEFQALRKLRRGFRTLRNNAIL